MNLDISLWILVIFPVISHSPIPKKHPLPCYCSVLSKSASWLSFGIAHSLESLADPCKFQVENKVNHFDMNLSRAVFSYLKYVLCVVYFDQLLGAGFMVQLVKIIFFTFFNLLLLILDVLGFFPPKNVHTPPSNCLRTRYFTST